MNPYLVALIGRSGSGKTTVANVLESKCRFRSVESFTTRPKRSEEEKGHIFVTEEWFQKEFSEGANEKIVAYTEFNGYRYFATESQINCSDVYIIDPEGVKSLKERYHGSKEIITIWFDASPEICKERMLSRGDSPEDVKKRLANDALIFTDDARGQSDYIIPVDEHSPLAIANEIMGFLLERFIKGTYK